MSEKLYNVHDNIIRNFSGRSYSEEQRAEIRKVLDSRQRERVDLAISKLEQKLKRKLS